jgi:hypothetical protein
VCATVIKGMANLIPNSDITVVIQGPLYLNQNKSGVDVLACIASIRSFLSGAKIVVSTWEQERRHNPCLSHLVDRIVYTPLPASLISHQYESNITRQIVSTKAGLACVDTPYSMKIRANILVKEKTEFFSSPGSKLNILALVSDPVTRFMLFVFPDFIQFGKTEIMKQLWDIEIDVEDYYLQQVPPSLFDIYSFPHSFKFSPEQYIGIAWAKTRHQTAPLVQHQFDVNYTDFLFWKDIVENDFNLFSPQESGFSFYPQRYIEGKFIDAKGKWLRQRSRKQFFMLLMNKYVLFIFSTNWWKHFVKYVLYTLSKRAYWMLHNKVRK